jgi:glutamate dehydrogenase (NADP+)
MKFCSAFMTELHKYIGSRIDIPAGDIGVGAREIGYLFGEYKKITSTYEGVLTGKPYMFGGSLMRPEATGYGAVYFTETMLEMEGKESLVGKICTVSGAGNVALHAIEKLQQIGAVTVSCTDSRGTIYDSRGVDLALLKELKLEKRASLEEYVKVHKEAKYIPTEEYPEGGHAVWNIPCFAAFPCATQNELTEIDAQNLVVNGCVSVTEGANMPSTPEAIEFMQSNGVCFAPAKAANAGGVATSGLEMSQNSLRLSWTREEVDAKLHGIMKAIHETCVKYGKESDGYTNYVNGANIGGFVKVADAMLDQGLV